MQPSSSQNQWNQTLVLQNSQGIKNDTGYHYGASGSWTGGNPSSISDQLTRHLVPPSQAGQSLSYSEQLDNGSNWSGQAPNAQVFRKQTSMIRNDYFHQSTASFQYSTKQSVSKVSEHPYTILPEANSTAQAPLGQGHRNDNVDYNYQQWTTKGNPQSSWSDLTIENLQIEQRSISGHSATFSGRNASLNNSMQLYQKDGNPMEHQRSDTMGPSQNVPPSANGNRLSNLLNMFHGASDVNSQRQHDLMGSNGPHNFPPNRSHTEHQSASFSSVGPKMAPELSAHGIDGRNISQHGTAHINAGNMKRHFAEAVGHTVHYTPQHQMLNAKQRTAFSSDTRGTGYSGQTAGHTLHYASNHRTISGCKNYTTNYSPGLKSNCGPSSLSTEVMQLGDQEVSKSMRLPPPYPKRQQYVVTVTEDNPGFGFRAENVVFMGNQPAKQEVTGEKNASGVGHDRSYPYGPFFQGKYGTQLSAAPSAQQRHTPPPQYTTPKESLQKSSGLMAHKAIAVVTPLSQPALMSVEHSNKIANTNEGIQCEIQNVWSLTGGGGNQVNKKSCIPCPSQARTNLSSCVSSPAGAKEVHKVSLEIPKASMSEERSTPGSATKSLERITEFPSLRDSTPLTPPTGLDVEGRDSAQASDKQCQATFNSPQQKDVTPTDVNSQVPEMHPSKVMNEKAGQEGATTFEWSTVPIVEWSMVKLHRLIAAQEYFNKCSVTDATKVIRLYWDGDYERLCSVARSDHYDNIMKEVSKVCSGDNQSVIFKQVKRQNWDEVATRCHVLEHDAAVPSVVYKLSWLNLNEQLDDIDEEHDPDTLKAGDQTNMNEVENDKMPDSASKIPSADVLLLEALNKTPAVTIEDNHASEMQEVPLKLLSTEMASPAGNNYAETNPFSAIEISVLSPEKAKKIFAGESVEDDEYGEFQKGVSKQSPKDCDDQVKVELPVQIFEEKVGRMEEDVELTKWKGENQADDQLDNYCCLAKWIDIVCGNSDRSFCKCQSIAEPCTENEAVNAETSVKGNVTSGEKEMDNVSTHSINSANILEVEIEDVFSSYEDVLKIASAMSEPLWNKPRPEHEPQGLAKMTEGCRTEIDIRDVNSESVKASVDEESIPYLSPTQDKLSWMTSLSLRPSFQRSLAAKGKHKIERKELALKKRRLENTPCSKPSDDSCRRQNIPKAMQTKTSKNVEREASTISLALYGSSPQRRNGTVATSRYLDHKFSRYRVFDVQSPPATISVRIYPRQKPDPNSNVFDEGTTKQRVLNTWKSSHVPSKRMTKMRGKSSKLKRESNPKLDSGTKGDKRPGACITGGALSLPSTDQIQTLLSQEKVTKTSHNSGWAKSGPKINVCPVSANKMIKPQSKIVTRSVRKTAKYNYGRGDKTSASLHPLKKPKTINLHRVKPSLMDLLHTEGKSKYDLGNPAVTPLQNNLTLEFKVLPKSFNFTEGEDRVETEKPIGSGNEMGSPKAVQAESVKTMTWKTDGAWSLTSRKNNHSMPSPSTEVPGSINIFQEFKRKYKDQEKT